MNSCATIEDKATSKSRAECCGIIAVARVRPLTSSVKYHLALFSWNDCKNEFLPQFNSLITFSSNQRPFRNTNGSFSLGPAVENMKSWHLWAFKRPLLAECFRRNGEEKNTPQVIKTAHLPGRFHIPSKDFSVMDLNANFCTLHFLSSLRLAFA